MVNPGTAAIDIGLTMHTIVGCNWHFREMGSFVQVRRLLDYLGGSPLTADPIEIDQLYQTVIDRRSAILVAAVCVWIAVVMAVYLTGAIWPLYWAVAEALITGLRWRLLTSWDRQSLTARSIFRNWLNLLTLGWSALFGLGSLGLLLSGHPDLSVVASVLAATIISVFSFRNAAAPRVAYCAICISGTLFLVGLAKSPFGVTWAAAGISFPWLLGLMLMTRQSHRLLVRLITAERIANRLANTDPLTGLSNRVHFEAHAGSVKDTYHGSAFAYLSLDLDGFKQVNDQYGHSAGDEVLREVARRLRASVRPKDLVFRLGGDEFVVYLPLADCSDCEKIAQRLIQEMEKPFKLSNMATVKIGASVGSACSSEMTGGADTLLKAADSALYQAKRQGRGQHVHASSADLSPKAVKPTEVH